MDRPRLTARVVSGLSLIHSLANADLEGENPGVWGYKTYNDAIRALEYIQALMSWYQKRKD
jgi:hypothetical protein